MMIEELTQGEFLSKASGQPKIWRSELNGKPIIEFEAWVSTEDIDRDGEILRMAGWRKPSLQKAKFLLFHDSWELPIGMPYWTRAKEADGTKGLYSKGRFGPQLHGLAVGELYEQGDMDSFSVGFKWFKRTFDAEADGQKKPFYEYIDMELYEYSAVNIASNSQAVLAVEQMINDAGDIKDMVAVIKGFLKQAEQPPIRQRESYIIKSVYDSGMSVLNAKIDELMIKLGDKTRDASEFDDDDEIVITIEDDDLDEIKVVI